MELMNRINDGMRWLYVCIYNSFVLSMVIGIPAIMIPLLVQNYFLLICGFYLYNAFILFPVMISLHGIMLRFLNEKDIDNFWRRFTSGFKDSFSKGVGVGMILSAVAAVFLLAVIFYWTSLFKWFFVALAAIVIAMISFIFPMMANREMSVLSYISNSFFFVFLSPVIAVTLLLNLFSFKYTAILFYI